jgi:Zn-dependent protease with chaperone function
MARAATPYPASPSHVLEGLTLADGHYKLRVFLVLLGLLFFFFFYLGLVAGTGVLVVVSLIRLPPVTGILASCFFGLFFLFLVKGLFKGRQVEKSSQVEIFADEQPRLFDFIRRVCEETNAPFPHRVFLNYEVNAAVFYDDSVLSLFRRTPKNLLLGMGLVNMLNLSEFKAVLAHEFGHFTQNSMKLGTYVYTANRIIGDMVFGRDWLDIAVLRLREGNERIAWLGWMIWGVLAGFRKVLEGFFYAINFLNLSLSRRMEFQADLVAVSVTGSDAIINGLVRTDFANLALMQAFGELGVAADHDIYTCDLFHHQNHAASYLRRLSKNPRLGEPPPAMPANASVTVEVFKADDENDPAPMWASHPSNYDREQNAKRDYVYCPIDDRSPWVLFDNPNDIRERVTWRFYRVVVRLKKDVPLTDADEVQGFIDDEHAETTYDPKYHGLYDGRLINPGELADLTRSVQTMPRAPEVLAEVFAGLYSGDFKERMEEYALLREELANLTGLRDGELELKGGEFTFRKRRYSLEDVDRLIRKVQQDMEQDQNWMADLDRRVFVCHYQMAWERGGKAAKELLDRYSFHLTLQGIARELHHNQEKMDAALAYLSGRRELSPDRFLEIMDIFRDAHQALTGCLNRADGMKLPALKNMRTGDPLGFFLLDKKLVTPFKRTARSVTGKKIGKLLQQMGEVQDRVRRIHFKSLGGILALQEKIAADRKVGRPAAEVPVPGTVVVELPAKETRAEEIVVATVVEDSPPARPPAPVKGAAPPKPGGAAAPKARTRHENLE